MNMWEYLTTTLSRCGRKRFLIWTKSRNTRFRILLFIFHDMKVKNNTVINMYNIYEIIM